ncbi:hypothetical protein Dsin_030314 [Dipteronia sinensis]|uniref:CCHC-type domain-containing protein n=1 Tax=Dipteronia sinensis TaxID=43782 RepID=A0AAD9ZJU0_9ROSI|nr:hypothetical protein Dsin_030314 [Dipteronia sinensis]
MSREVGKFLGKMIGEVREVDLENTRDEASMFLRVRVVIDIDVPLQRCLLVDLLGIGKVTTLLLRYERLSDYCYRCGLVGHVHSNCPAESSKSGPLSDQQRKLGVWLRTSSPPKKYFGKRLGNNRPKIFGSYVKRHADLGQCTNNEIRFPKNQLVTLDVPVTQKDKRFEEMGQVESGDASMKPSIIVQEHGEIQSDRQDTVGDDVVKQVAGKSVDQVHVGHEPIFLVPGGPSLSCGPVQIVGFGLKEDNSPINIINYLDIGSVGSLHEVPLKAKAGVWKRRPERRL